MTNPLVRNSEAKSRLEIEENGEIAFAEYHLLDDRIVFPHTVVPEPLGGRGLGTALIEAGLDFARREGLLVVPRCPFFQRYFERHPELQDLIHPEARTQAAK